MPEVAVSASAPVPGPVRDDLGDVLGDVLRPPFDDVLDDVLGAAAAGTGGGVAVVGGPGSGRTTLVLRAETRARAAGFGVVGLAGHPRDSVEPFLAVRDLARQLGRPIGPTPAPEAEDAMALLAGAAARSPCLLSVDDADDVDDASAEVLASVLRRVSGLGRVAAVVGCTESGARRLLRAARHVRVLRLRPLGREQCRQLVLDRLGPVDGRLVDEVCRTARGHLGVLDALLDWCAATPSPAAGAVRDAAPERLVVLAREGMSALPERVRRAVVVAAVSRAEPPEVLRAALRAADLDPSDLLAAETAGLLRLCASGVEPVMPFLPAALAAAEPIDVRRDAHSAVAAALRDRDPASGAAASRARHLLAATAVVPEDGAAADLAADVAVATEEGTRWHPRDLLSGELVRTVPVEEHHDEAEPALALVVRSAAMAMSGRPVLAGDALRDLRASTVTAAVPAEPDLPAILGLALLGLGQEDAAAQMLTRVADAAERHGSASVLPATLSVLADLEWRLARWELSRTHAERAARLAERGRRPDLRAFALALLARHAAVRGDEATTQLAAQALRCAEASGARLAEPVVHAALGLRDLARDAAGPAADALALAARLEDEAGLGEPSYVQCRADLVEACSTAGRRPEAAAAAAVLREAAAREPATSWVRVAAARAEALVAPPPAVARLLTAAVAAAEGLPYERARAQELLGRELRRTGRRSAAVAALDAALTAYVELGARAFAERTRAELRRCGAPSGVRRGPAADHLTGRELDVARLVAAGRTNKEAAAALGVSVKTVEYHLSNAYARLGVRSRVELVGHPAVAQA